ncbi:TonB-dependent receptor [Draconibacterium orientale]|uniref:TonB-dependent receptor n=1 Tax=Draconibacterium orientale TaxID=1168034 RepID=UPI002ABE6DBA|nr:TonB-dependent receptor [Draconibacterium orientale]
MRLTLYVLFLAVIQGFAVDSYSQVTKLSLEASNSTVREVLTQIENETEFYFLYNSKIVDVDRKIDVSLQSKKIEEVLDVIFDKTSVEYTIVDRQIVLSNSELHSDGEQKRQIKGKVSDENGEPLPGVTIVFQGTTQGTISDIDGNYSMVMPDNAEVLVFSFIGMMTQEVNIDGKEEVNVTLLQDYIGIEEVVAIGYGTTKKEDLVSSVAQVKAEIIENQPTVRVDQALQGRAAGVEVTSTSGTPGSNAVVRIRGTSSINGNNNPLYVIDGFIAGTDFNLNNLNVNDIESIEVLKDATALAIYGTRGASGVILITSKNGKNLAKGKTQVSVNQYLSYQQTANRIELADSKLYAEYRNEEAQFVPGPDGYGYTDSSLPLIFDDPASAPYTDWIDLVSQNGLINNTDVSITGNADKANYYTSFNHFDQEGVVRASGIERFALRTNLDFNLSEKFTTGVRLNISKFKKENNKVAYSQIVTAVLPIREVYNEDGSFTSTNPVSGSLQRNPEADIQMRVNHDLVTNIISNAYLEFKPVKDLVFRSSVGVELNYYKGNVYNPGALPERLAQGVGGYANIDTNQKQSVLNENTVTYNLDLGEHNIKILGGFTMQKISNESVSTAAEGFSNDVLEFNNLGFGSDPLLNQVGSGYNQRTFVSMLSRINYGYKGKYLLTLVGRRDGSSVFENGNKYAFFPSVGVAWNVYKEQFMEDFGSISMMKLRGSYGIVGEQGVNPYNSMAKFNNSATYFNETLVPAVLIGGLPSKDLTWETTKQWDLGVEMGFLNNRFGFEVDLYKKTTEDLLLARDLPGTAGGSQLQNVGSIENKGLEFSVHSVNISKPNFSWETTFTLSANRNKVLDLGGDDYINLSQPSNQGGAGLRLISGEPAPVFVGVTYLGTYKTEQEIIDDGRVGVSFLGGPRYVDLDGNSVINDEDKLPIGSPQPDFYGGLRNSINYKGITFDCFFQYSYGNEMYNLLTHVGWFGRGDQVLVPDVANRWIEGVNETSDVPRAGTSTSLFNPNSTALIEDASFIRLKSVSLGYNLPVKKLGIDNLFSRFNVYVAGNNLLLITNWTLGDPEVSNYGSNNLSQGVATGQYPYARTYTVGVKIDF